MRSRTDSSRARLSALARGPLERLLARLAEVCAAAPRAVLGVALVTVLASLFITVTRLEFRGSRDDIASARAIPGTSRYLELSREFPEDSSLVVAIDARDRPRAEAFADALAGRLARLPQVGRVFHRIDPADFGGRALLYMPAGTLARLRDAVTEERDLLADLADRPGLVTLLEGVNREVTSRLGTVAADDLLGPSPGEGRSQGIDVRGLAAFARALTRSVRGGPPPSLADAGLPGGEPAASGDRPSLARPRYLATENGRFLLVLVTPTRDDGEAPRRFFDRAAEAKGDRDDPVPAVRAAVVATRAAFPGIDAGVTGPRALAADEQAATRRDVSVAMALGFLGNVVPLLLLFRRRVRTAYVLACLAVGLAWSFGFVTLVVGHLNMLSAVFASVLIGVGINFPIHLLARYEEAEREGNTPAAALGLMVVRTGGAVGASTLVLVAGALATTVADLPAIAELGVISAAGLGLSLLAAYSVFPALLVLEGRRRARGGDAALAAGAPSVWARAGRHLGRARWGFFGGLTLAAAGAALALWHPPSFDSNLLNLQAPDSEAVRYERALIAGGGQSTGFVLTDAADLAEARRKVAALSGRPLVDRVESAVDLIPADQAARGRIVDAIRPALAGVEVRASRAPAFALEPFRDAVSRLAFKLGAASGPEVSGARDALVGLLRAIERAGPAAAGRRLADTQDRLAAEFADAVALVRANLDPGPITVETLPADLRARFVGETGRLLLRVYPTEDTWERTAMARFLADVRAVDPGVTGPRVQGFEVTETIRRDYARATALAVVAIAVVALVAFRDVKDALLAMLPLATGGLWTLGAMVALRLEFNLANLYAVPLVIGLAVDSGMNLVARAREEQAAAAAVVGRSVGKSVLLASLTTIWGFAALLPAHHQGIASLGLLLTLGSALTSLAAFVVLPPALGAVARYRAARHPRRAAFAPALALLVAVAAAGGTVAVRAAAAADDPASAVRGTVEAARAIIADRSAGADRDARIRALMASRFDTEAMARTALGPNADRLSPAERAEYVDLFTTLFTRSYSKMVLSFLDEVEVRYGEAAPSAQGFAVKTTLRKAQGETLPVDYHLVRREAGFALDDVVIDGLSLVSSYRAQFERVIRTGGAAALLERMRARRDAER